MCLIALALGVHKRYPLVMIANRDEFHARPALPLHAWGDIPGIVAGRDQRGGGTWLGAHSSGRIAALTNYREASHTDTDLPSRGQLVTDYLTTNQTPARWVSNQVFQRYAGFNLLTGTIGGDMVYVSNRHPKQVLTRGVHGLSNGGLNSEWPKVTGLRTDLSALLESVEDVDVGALFALLGDTRIADDEALPETGVDMELERRLSARCIISEDYGTRAQTVVLADAVGELTVIEQTLDNTGKPISREQVILASPGVVQS